MTKEKVLEIIERKKDHTTEEVAILMNLSYSTVRYWLRKAKEQGLAIPRNQKSGRKQLKLK